MRLRHGGVSAAILAHVQKGEHVLASNRLYGRTTQLLTQELSRFGVATTLVDTTDPGQVEEVLRAKGGRLLLVETLSNPLLRLADLPALASLARTHGCLLAVDNTFATPGMCRPLETGADMVIESLTKVIGGHSDVTLGVLCGGNFDKPAAEQAAQVAQVVSIWGLATPPFDCWLAEPQPGHAPSASADGIRERSGSGGLAGAATVGTAGDLSRSARPSRPRTGPASFAGESEPPLFGTMLCFELSGGRDAVNRFMRQAPGIPFSPSLGNTTTTCSHPASTSHRYVSPASAVPGHRRWSGAAVGRHRESGSHSAGDGPGAVRRVGFRLRVRPFWREAATVVTLSGVGMSSPCLPLRG